MIELFEENNLLRISLQGEMTMRQKLEARNEELNGKLIDAKQGLQETRNALLKVQQTTEQLVARRDEREQQLSKIMSISKNYEKRIQELEMQAMKAEDAAKLQTLLTNAKMNIIEKEDTISELQRQGNRSVQTITSMRSEIKELNDSKFDLEGRLAHAHEKMRDLERNLRLEQDRVILLQEHEEKTKRLLIGGGKSGGSDPNRVASPASAPADGVRLMSPKLIAVTNSMNNAINKGNTMVDGVLNGSKPAGTSTGTVSASSSAVPSEPAAAASVQEVIQNLPIVNEINHAIQDIGNRSLISTSTSTVASAVDTFQNNMVTPLSSSMAVEMSSPRMHSNTNGSDVQHMMESRLTQFAHDKHELEERLAKMEKLVAMGSPGHEQPQPFAIEPMYGQPPVQSGSAPSTFTTPFYPQSPSAQPSVQTVKLDDAVFEQLKQFIAAQVSANSHPADRVQALKEEIPGPPTESPPMDMSSIVGSPTSILRKSLRPTNSNPTTPSSRVSFSLDRNRVQYIPPVEDSQRSPRSRSRRRSGSSDSTDSTDSKGLASSSEDTVTDEEVAKAVQSTVKALGSDPAPIVISKTPPVSAPVSVVSTPVVSAPSVEDTPSVPRKHRKSLSSKHRSEGEPSDLATVVEGNEEERRRPSIKAVANVVTLANAAEKHKHRSRSRAASEDPQPAAQPVAPAVVQTPVVAPIVVPQLTAAAVVVPAATAEPDASEANEKDRHHRRKSRRDRSSDEKDKEQDEASDLSPDKMSRRKSRRSLEREEREKEAAASSSSSAPATVPAPAEPTASTSDPSPEKPSRRKSRKSLDEDKPTDESDKPSRHKSRIVEEPAAPADVIAAAAAKLSEVSEEQADKDKDKERRKSMRKSRSRSDHHKDKDKEAEAAAEPTTPAPTVAPTPASAPAPVAVIEEKAAPLLQAKSSRKMLQPQTEAADDDPANAALALKIHGMKDEINTLIATYREYKQQVKTFNDDFNKQYGHPPTKEERRVHGKEIFRRYNKVTHHALRCCSICPDPLSL